MPAPLIPQSLPAGSTNALDCQGTTTTFSFFYPLILWEHHEHLPQNPETETGPALPLVVVSETPKIPFFLGEMESWANTYSALNRTRYKLLIFLTSFNPHNSSVKNMLLSFPIYR